MVVLTFDDGPSGRTTKNLLEILERHQAHATFFVVGKMASYQEHLLEDIVKHGHELGNHSYDHSSFRKLSSQKRLEQMQRTNELLMKHQKSIRWFRPPYGSYNDNILEEIDNQNMCTVLWSIDPKDWKNPSPTKLVQRIQTKLQHGSVILLHEHHPNTVKALNDLLNICKEGGFLVVSLREFFEKQREEKTHLILSKEYCQKGISSSKSSKRPGEASAVFPPP